jgi:hypothetical protein
VVKVKNKINKYSLSTVRERECVVYFLMIKLTDKKNREREREREKM